MASNGGNLQGGGAGSAGTGLDPKLAAALSYVLGIVTGLIFVLLERDPYVRFHAFQSILLTAAWVIFWVGFSVISGILALAPILGFLALIVGFLLSIVLGLGGLLLWMVLIIRAYQGSRLKLPVIGDMAERYA